MLMSYLDAAEAAEAAAVELGVGQSRETESSNESK
jgi:hypothetical protein